MVVSGERGSRVGLGGLGGLTVRTQAEAEIGAYAPRSRDARVCALPATAQHGSALATPVRSLSLSIVVSSWRSRPPTHLAVHTSVRHILHIRSATPATNSYDTPSTRRQVDGDPDGLRVYVETKQ